MNEQKSIKPKIRPRKSRDRRLLEALLSCMVVIRPKAANSYLQVDAFGIYLKPNIEYRLIKIKDSMYKRRRTKRTPGLPASASPEKCKWRKTHEKHILSPHGAGGRNYRKVYLLKDNPYCQTCGKQIEVIE